VSGTEIERGTLVVRDGKVVAVGAPPAGAGARGRRRGRPDRQGRHARARRHAQPHRRRFRRRRVGGDASRRPDLDSFDARSSGLRRAVAGGITTVNVMPGSGHLMSGQTVYLKLRAGSTIDELTIPRADGQPLGGMKMANGTNSIRRPGARFPPPGPGRPPSSATQFVKAQEYREKVQKAGGDAGEASAARPRARGPRRGARRHPHRALPHAPPRRHPHGAAPREGVRLHARAPARLRGVEGRRRDRGRRAPASIIVIDSPGGKLEAMDVSIENGAALERAGASSASTPTTSSPTRASSCGRPALAVRYGMSREKPCTAVTMAGARMLSLDARSGRSSRARTPTSSSCRAIRSASTRWSSRPGWRAQGVRPRRPGRPAVRVRRRGREPR
jgi:hypothetical protein